MNNNYSQLKENHILLVEDGQGPNFSGKMNSIK